MNVASIPVNDPTWRDFTAGHPDASPFHLPAWAALIADCYHFEAFVLAVRDENGELAAGLPTVAVDLPFSRERWVSLPFTDTCPILVRPNVSLDDAVRAISGYVDAGDRDLEVRSPLPALDGLYPIEVGYQHVLSLPGDPADLHVQRNFRQHRNQAKSRGVTVTRSATADDVATFYRLQTLTRRRLGVPVQPRRWFELVLNGMFAIGHGFVATAVLDDKPIAACLYLTHNRTIVAKYSASDPDRKDTGASHLIHWEVMSAACAEGFHTYDLGRADPDAKGLRVFKTRMGADETPLFYTHIARNPPDGKRPSGGELSRRVIRRSPPWVCRAAGEALYRWTA